MGIQDRDYYRDGSRSLFDSWARQGVTVWLIAITCGVFFGQCVTGDPLRSPLVGIGAFWSPDILDGEVWRLVTPLFLHASIWHLFCNMLVLYFIGSRLEELYGRWEFLAVYLVSGIFASSVKFGLESAGIGAPVPSLGASGAISALVVIFAFRFPREQILVFGILPMPVWVAASLFVALDALGALGVGRKGIGYVAHLSGALFGLLYYQTGFRFGDLFARRERSLRERARPQLRIVPAEADEPTPEPVGAAVESPPRSAEAGALDEQLEARLDQVLAKVSKYGQESLTPEEREILFKASELYKRRRK